MIGVSFFLARGQKTDRDDYLGGMKAVIWSDVIQIVVLFGAILTAIIMAAHLAGGPPVVFDQPARLRAVDFASHGLGDGHISGICCGSAGQRNKRTQLSRQIKYSQYAGSCQK